MSHLSSTTNSTSQTQHQANLQTIKSEDESDDDEDKSNVLYETEHIPEDYDPECNCRTCELVRKLQAECDCEECREENLPSSLDNQENRVKNVVQSIENVIPTHQMESANTESSSIHIDVTTSEHISEDDHYCNSGGSTPDYAPRFFDDESESENGGNSSSYDDESNDGKDNYTKLEHECNSDDDDDERVKMKQPNEMNQVAEQISPENGIPTEMEPVNTESSIHNDDASMTSEHDQDEYSRSSTPDYIPRFFDDDESESEDSSSDDDDKVEGDYKDDQDQESYNDDNDDKDDKDDNDEDYKASGQNSQTSGPRDPITRKMIKSGKRIQIACRLCGRNICKPFMKRHLGTHKNIGFRCAWSGCGFFYSNFPEATKHVRSDHLSPTAKDTKRKSVYQYLNRINPDTNEEAKVVYRHPRKVVIADNISDSGHQIKCPICETSFLQRNYLLKHYRFQHQAWRPYYCKWPKCDFVASMHNIVLLHATRAHFKNSNQSEVRSYVGKHQTPAPNDPLLESLIASCRKEKRPPKKTCPKCGRSVQSHYFERHLRTHTRIRCNWSGCGIFFSLLPEAKEHLCSVHLQCTVEQLASSQLASQYLVKVSSKTGRTIKLRTL